MRRISSVILCFIASALLYSCSSSRKNFVPFTRDLRAKLEKENIDLRQVQFYVDQKLVLSRNLGDQKVEVKSGVVKLENGQYTATTSSSLLLPPASAIPPTTTGS
jgi:hypothetical protein